MNWSALSLPDWLRWLGVAAGLAILPMIYWVMTSIGKNISETTLTKNSHELITHGPYNWIRHPLYTFATIGFVSLAVVASNWLMLAMALIAFGAIAWFVVPREEAELINKFGSDYQKYQERTGRFTPWSRRAR
jgi:protein-S-isoprenylcysteine O-methyltransferase Ste14